MKSPNCCINRSVVADIWRRYFFVGLFSLVGWIVCAVIPVYFSVLDQPTNEILSETVLTYGLYGGLVMAFVFAPLSALVSFGFVFKKTSAEFFGGAPLKRNTLFCSLSCAQFIPLVLANAIGLVLLGAIVIPAGVSVLVVLQAFVIATLFTFMFSGFAIFAVQLAGGRGFAAVVYLLLTVGAEALQALVKTMHSMAIFGSASLEHTVFEWFTPFVLVLSNCVVETAGTQVVVVGFWIIGLLCVIAAALLGAAAVLFCRRNLEVAEDPAAIPVLRPIVGVAMSFCAGCVLAVFLAVFFLDGTQSIESFSSLCVFLIASLGVGSLLGFVLFEVVAGGGIRALPACKRSIAMLVVLSVAVGAGMAVYCDNESTWKADPSAVVGVTVSGDQYGFNTVDPRMIAQVCELQGLVLDAKEAEVLNPRDVETTYYTTVAICFELSDGKTVSRNYSMSMAGDESTLELREALDALAASEPAIESRVEFVRFCVNDPRSHVTVWAVEDEEGHDVLLTHDRAVQLFEEALESDLRNYSPADSCVEIFAKSAADTEVVDDGSCIIVDWYYAYEHEGAREDSPEWNPGSMSISLLDAPQSRDWLKEHGIIK